MRQRHVTTIGETSLSVFPLCLGGSVFGWTADEERSFRVLDAYAAAGGDFIDTADVYMESAPGNRGGESEAIIGRWLARRADRDRFVVATKVGMLSRRRGLSAANIRAGVEDSLRRLRRDHVDLYYAHADDPQTPLEETLTAFDRLVRDGKVCHLGVSNHPPPRLAEALAVSDRDGLARYAVVQAHYNLIERSKYEGELAPLCAREGLPCIPYFPLAEGFLTGKYRSGGQAVRSARAPAAAARLAGPGAAVLAELDEVAAAHGTTVAAVSLAWLAAQETVAVPVASARTPGQLAELIPAVELALTPEELARLRAAS